MASRYRVIPFFCFVLTLCSDHGHFSDHCGICWAKVDGPLGLLERIKLLHVSNRERLATWRGEARIETYTKDPDKLWDRAVEVQFAYDRDRDAWLFHWTYVRTKDGKFNGTQFGGMYLDQTWYRYGPYVPTVKMRQGVTLRPGPPPRIGPMTTVFDPMYYFKVKNRDLEFRMDLWFEHADSDWLSLVIERDGDLVTVAEDNVELPCPPTRYVFDLSKAGNLLSVVARDEVREVRWFTTWEERSGVWVPKTAHYENKKHDGSRVSRRVVTWQRSIVNQPIAGETFTLDAMGVLPGADVQDSRIGQQWRYKESESKDGKEKEPPVLENRRWATGLAVVAGLVLLLVVAGLAVAKRRGTTSR